MTGRARCLPGCACKKHTPAPRPRCPEGCTCGRHKKSSKIDWSDREVVRLYVRTQRREKYAQDPSAQRDAVRRWQMRNPYYVRYRLTSSDWLQLLESQNARCYLCGDPFDLSTADRSIHVDHDHACCPGERSCGVCVRGLACRACNHGVGSFGDDPDRMLRAADALEAAQAKLKKQ